MRWQWDQKRWRAAEETSSCWSWWSVQLGWEGRGSFKGMADLSTWVLQDAFWVFRLVAGRLCHPGSWVAETKATKSFGRLSLSNDNRRKLSELWCWRKKSFGQKLYLHINKIVLVVLGWIFVWDKAPERKHIFNIKEAKHQLSFKTRLMTTTFLLNSGSVF